MLTISDDLRVLRTSAHSPQDGDRYNQPPSTKQEFPTGENHECDQPIDQTDFLGTSMIGT
jgi:hypothetical protein